MAVAVPTVSAAVGGLLDEAVVRRLLESAGAAVGAVYGKNGKQALLERIAGYNHAARYQPWLVLLDLNSDGECAPPVRSQWLPHPADLMCFRIAVREVEAWLLADRERIATVIGVRRALIPGNPEQLADPKQALVNLARQSRRRAICKDIVPRPGSGRDVGPGYVSQMVEFVVRHWSPDEASQAAPSLRRARDNLARIICAARSMLPEQDKR